MTKARPMAERFWEKVPVRSPWPEDCWEWAAFRNPAGYGMFGVARATPRMAHRVAWMLTGSNIPDDMELDHACRNRACVRPEHLSLVEKYYNGRQGGATYARLARARTHCKNGHRFDEANTYRYGPRRIRHCRTCGREKMRRRRAEGKA